MYKLCIIKISFILFLLFELVFSIEKTNEKPYFIKLQQLRLAALANSKNQLNQKKSESIEIERLINAKSQKPRRYKCVLIEDDTNDEHVNESERSFIKTISFDNEEQTIKNMYAPSFASEIKVLKVNENNNIIDNNNSPYITTIQPIVKINTLSRKNNVQTISYWPFTTPVYNNLQNSSEKPLPVRLPVVHGVSLKESIQSKKFLSTQHNLQPLHSSEYLINSKNNHESLNYASEIKPVDTVNNQQFTNLPRRTILRQTTVSPLATINNPQKLILSKEHCQMISHYALLYQVKDIKGWVHHNCAFAKMYLPNATCSEIDVLVASCF